MLSVREQAPAYNGLRVTREEYLDLENDGFKYDMIDGVLHMTPSAFFDHNHAQTRLAQALANYLDRSPIGVCVIETDIFLPDGGDVLRPDILVILKEHMGIIRKRIHGAPDIVVEVLSESTEGRDLGIKADRYLSCGVAEYWIADPDRKSLRLWINEAGAWRKEDVAVLKSQRLPGFELAAAHLFRPAI